MKFFLFAAVILTASTVLAEPEVFTLDNGLQVVLDDMHFAPTAVVLVQYQVGSRNETADISGISHFTEHMMFNGTQNMPGGMFWQQVQMEGGQANGGTSTNTTSYFIYLPSTKLEKAITIEADRMHNCLMDSAAIAQEIGVVTDEWRLSQDTPDSQLYYAANEAFYGDHPLSRTVLGSGETIAAFCEQSVRDYYETWYRPSNAILIVAGDFDRDQARALVEEHFGPILCEGPSPDNVPAVTEWDHPERVDLEFPAESDRFTIYFRGCEMDSPDIPALMLLDTHFSGGRLGWMNRELVNSGSLTSGYSSAPRGLDATPFRFYGNVPSGTEPDSIIALITEEAFRLGREELDSDRLRMLQDFIVASELTGVSTPVSQAYEYAYYISMFGDINGYDEILSEISSLTPEDVREVASRYFTPENMMVTVLHATEGNSGIPATSTAGTTETDIPEITDWSGLDFPEEFQLPGHSISEGVEQFTLDNGLLLLVQEDHSFPNMEIMVTVPMCTRREDPSRCGISSIVAEMMLRGTEELDYEAFHERLAVLGSSTWINVSGNYSMANSYGLSEHGDVWFTSLSDMLMRPALTEEDFESAISQSLGSLARSAESPYYQIFTGFDQIILQPGNSRITTEETVSSITHQDAIDWWKTTVRPEGTVVAVVGDITPEEALALAEKHFGSWENPDEPLPELVAYQFTDSPGDTLIVTMPGKIQVAEMAGCRGPAPMSDDYIPFQVMTGILGGGISSRLGKNVRETQGLAYVVGSRVDSQGASYHTGSRFMSYLATGAPTAVRALEAVIYESNRIAEEGIDEEELLLAQSRSIGRQAISFDSYDSQARYLASVAITGLPLDIDLTNLEKTVELNAQDIQDIAGKYFSENWFVVAAGGIDENMEPLE